MVTTYARIVLLCLLSAAAFGQTRTLPRSTIPYATSSGTGGVRLYNGLNQTGSGFALDATAGKQLKDLVDANTAAIATKAPAFTVGAGLSLTGGVLSATITGGSSGTGTGGGSFYVDNSITGDGSSTAPLSITPALAGYAPRLGVSNSFAVSGTLTVGSSTSGTIGLGSAMLTKLSGQGLTLNSGLDVSGDLTILSANGRVLGFRNFATGMTLAFQFGDVSNQISNTWGSSMMLTAYHGVLINSNSGSSGPALRVLGTNASQPIATFASSTSAVVASLAQSGQLTVNGGIKFSDGTTLTTAPASGTVSGGGSQTFVTPLTRQAVADAIAAIPANNTAVTTLYLSGTYVNGSKNDAILLNRSNLRLVALNGPGTALIAGDANNGTLMKIHSATNLIIDGIDFYSPKVGQDYGLIMFNQEGNTDRVTIRNGVFDCRAGAYNCIIDVEAADNDADGAGKNHDNTTIEGCTFYGGRMAIERLNHADGWKGVVRGKNFRVVRNRFLRLGLNDGNHYGMGISSSGMTTGLQVVDNYFEDCQYLSIEDIGGFDGLIASNVINTTGVSGGGLSLTDGGNTELSPSNPNRGAHDNTIIGNTINVTGQPAVFYYAYDNVIGPQNWKGGQGLGWQHSDRNVIDGLKMTINSDTFIYFDASNDNRITGGRYVSTKTGTVYQKWAFVNGSVRNVLSDFAYGGANSANGNQIQNSSTPNYWYDLMQNGVLISDQRTGSGNQGN